MNVPQLLKMQRRTVEQRKWRGFLLLGMLLLLGGVLCLLLPVFSEFAASTVFGLVLVAIGVIKIIQTLWVKSLAGIVRGR
jgi:uncharacterized membrane protein HdeD (DUF308 family)